MSQEVSPYLESPIPKKVSRKGESCLQMLATHENTAKHLVDKLCQHFIGDTPKELSEQMVAIYLKGEGELQPVYRLLLESTEANELQTQSVQTTERVAICGTSQC